jgi:hypothetical protein
MSNRGLAAITNESCFQDIAYSSLVPVPVKLMVISFCINCSKCFKLGVIFIGKRFNGSYWAIVLEFGSETLFLLVSHVAAWLHTLAARNSLPKRVLKNYVLYLMCLVQLFFACCDLSAIGWPSCGIAIILHSVYYISMAAFYSML